MNRRSRMTAATTAVGTLVGLLLVAAGAPMLVVVPAMLLVLGPAWLTYAWLTRAENNPQVRIRGTALAAGGLAALVAGCYGWHPIACVAAAGATWLITAAALDDRDRQHASRKGGTR